jgi:hypothetical protein
MTGSALLPLYQNAVMARAEEFLASTCPATRCVQTFGSATKSRPFSVKRKTIFFNICNPAVVVQH